VQLVKADEAAHQAAFEAERRANEEAAAKSAAEYEAHRAAQRERDEDDDWISNTGDYPVYWGGYGYGLTYWPSTPVVRPNPPSRPVQLPVRPVAPRR
jgi:hypothetical protein